MVKKNWVHIQVFLHFFPHSIAFYSPEIGFLIYFILDIRVCGGGRTGTQEENKLSIKGQRKRGSRLFPQVERQPGKINITADFLSQMQDGKEPGMPALNKMPKRDVNWMRQACKW
ncbi:hypothetical protein Y1Q_0015672 [Alligator mississippiensis]|uniref:Uncharacterized protein n=1 Tax=Alligator mississippiensis TaxID=8496 RepID=A0A151NP56_ALLMI|nr:hypothetical protein Y1Q_0015672 [Alligator mississippiensis]